MKIIWSNHSSRVLINIYRYYRDTASLKVAMKIKNDIFKSTMQLVEFPKSGQIETNLVNMNMEHRYIVSGNYKIIYREVNEGILITDIFDSRQDPLKLKKKK